MSDNISFIAVSDEPVLNKEVSEPVSAITQGNSLEEDASVVSNELKPVSECGNVEVVSEEIEEIEPIIAPEGSRPNSASSDSSDGLVITKALPEDVATIEVDRLGDAVEYAQNSVTVNVDVEVDNAVEYPSEAIMDTSGTKITGSMNNEEGQTFSTVEEEYSSHLLVSGDEVPKENNVSLEKSVEEEDQVPAFVDNLQNGRSANDFAYNEVVQSGEYVDYYGDLDVDKQPEMDSSSEDENYEGREVDMNLFQQRSAQAHSAKSLSQSLESEVSSTLEQGRRSDHQSELPAQRSVSLSGTGLLGGTTSSRAKVNLSSLFSATTHALQQSPTTASSNKHLSSGNLSSRRVDSLVSTQPAPSRIPVPKSSRSFTSLRSDFESQPPNYDDLGSEIDFVPENNEEPFFYEKNSTRGSNISINGGRFVQSHEKQSKRNLSIRPETPNYDDLSLNAEYYSPQESATSKLSYRRSESFYSQGSKYSNRVPSIGNAHPDDYIDELDGGPRQLNPGQRPDEGVSGLGRSGPQVSPTFSNRKGGGGAIGSSSSSRADYLSALATAQTTSNASARLISQGKHASTNSREWHQSQLTERAAVPKSRHRAGAGQLGAAKPQHSGKVVPRGLTDTYVPGLNSSSFRASGSSLLAGAAVVGGDGSLVGVGSNAKGVTRSADNMGIEPDGSRRKSMTLVAGIQTAPIGSINLSKEAASNSSTIVPDGRSAYLSLNRFDGPKLSDIVNNRLAERSESDRLFFSKKGRPVHYTPKTLAEYRASLEQLGARTEDPNMIGVQKRKGVPNGYVELGRLGPDLQSEEHLRALQAAEKQRSYAAAIARRNKMLQRGRAIQVLKMKNQDSLDVGLFNGQQAESGHATDTQDATSNRNNAHFQTSNAEVAALNERHDQDECYSNNNNNQFPPNSQMHSKQTRVKVLNTPNTSNTVHMNIPGPLPQPQQPNPNNGAFPTNNVQIRNPDPAAVSSSGYPRASYNEGYYLHAENEFRARPRFSDEETSMNRPISYGSSGGYSHGSTSRAPYASYGDNGVEYVNDSQPQYRNLGNSNNSYSNVPSYSEGGVDSPPYGRPGKENTGHYHSNSIQGGETYHRFSNSEGPRTYDPNAPPSSKYMISGPASQGYNGPSRGYGGTSNRNMDIPAYEVSGSSDVSYDRLRS